ncbi:MAG: hypothetical protein RIB45_02175 [Marivibrio sp.]|uniref:hypothetical protein n=1 Tax=Marivibrio sp. TaxID=2039719 RepID=UPI0032EFF054
MTEHDPTGGAGGPGGPGPGWGGPPPGWGAPPYAQVPPWGAGWHPPPPHPGVHPAYPPGPPPGWPPPGYPPPGYAPYGQQQGAPGPDPFMAAMEQAAEQNGLGGLKQFLNVSDGEFWKGALVGAAVVLLMTNEDLRDSLMTGAAKAAGAMKAGLGGEEAPDDAESGGAAADDEDASEEERPA